MRWLSFTVERYSWGVAGSDLHDYMVMIWAAYADGGHRMAMERDNMTMEWPHAQMEVIVWLWREII